MGGSLLPAEYRVYDSKRGEFVDPVNGEVEEEHQVVYRPTVRASDYAEWEGKQHHSVLVEERDRKLYAKVQSVGEAVGVPKRLRDEVFQFIKRARALKARPEFCGKPFHPYKDKFILAAYYVVASRLGDTSTAERIATMPCGDGGEPCYLSRRRGDDEFRRYLKVLMRYAYYVYQNGNGGPADVLDELVHVRGLPVPPAVCDRAKEIATALREQLSGRRAQTIAVVALKIAMDEAVGDKRLSNVLVKEACRKLRISEQSVNTVVRKVVCTKLVG